MEAALDNAHFNELANTQAILKFGRVKAPPAKRERIPLGQVQLTSGKYVNGFRRRPSVSLHNNTNPCLAIWHAQGSWNWIALTRDGTLGDFARMIHTRRPRGIRQVSEKHYTRLSDNKLMP